MVGERSFGPNVVVFGQVVHLALARSVLEEAVVRPAACARSQPAHRSQPLASWFRPDGR